MSKHPVLESFGKWLSVNIVWIMIIWIFLPKWNPPFLRTLLINMGTSYYDFFGFFWFILFFGSFVFMVIWPSMPKRSYLR